MLPQHLRETAEDGTLCDHWSEYSFPSLSITQLWGSGGRQKVSCCHLKLLSWTSFRLWRKKSTVSHECQDPKYAVSGRDRGVEVD